MKPREEVRREFVRQWLLKATGDLAAARHLLTGGEDILASAAFHAQQAAEKALKAALVWHQVEAPKTHNLALLVDLVASADVALAGKVRGSVSLTPYGVEARYPGDLPAPSSAQVREAVDLAGSVLQSVLEYLPSEFRAVERRR